MDYTFDENKIKHLLKQFVQQYMKENHLTQQQLADLTGLSVNTIKNFLYEKVVPSVDVLYTFSSILHVDMIEVLDLPGAHQTTEKKKEEVLQRIDTLQEQLEKIKNELNNDR